MRTTTQWVESLIVVVHILNNKVCCTEVNESSAGINILEEWSKQLNEFFFAIIVKDEVLLFFDNRVPLIEGLISVLASHISFELSKVATRDVDHIFLSNTGLV